MGMQPGWLLLLHFLISHWRVLVYCQDAGVLRAVDVKCLQQVLGVVSATMVLANTVERASSTLRYGRILD